ncbi:F-box protein At5g07610-like [Rutidosis leptorrhynchoides]|uniref:F-box protein At5g07610-like n=1 Tax=Rutidosis leptorrhynchoides TaxID=125765 RepID=UPI003A99E8DA
MAMGTHSYSFSSVDKVTSCGDLLSEILLRLPVRSLFRFMSISKHWNSLITNNPTLKSSLYPHPDDPSGLFIPTLLGQQFIFVPFNVDNPVKAPFITLDIDPSAECSVVIKQSCNGLMLCCNELPCHERICGITKKHYVYNPTINEITTFDGPGLPAYGLNHRGINIAFDPSKSPHYRIIYIYYHRGKHMYQINMYSSQTRVCKLSLKVEMRRYSDIEFNSGVYWNNAVHWIDRSGYIVYFNLDQQMIYQKLTPSARLDFEFKNYIFESRDHFLLVEIIMCPPVSKFKIYELKRDYSEWFVKYNVDLAEFGGPLREIFNVGYDVTTEFDVLALVLGEKEGDSFLVVEIPEKIVRLNLELKTYTNLHYITFSRIDQRVCRRFFQWPYMYQFMSLSTAGFC